MLRGSTLALSILAFVVSCERIQIASDPPAPDHPSRPIVSPSGGAEPLVHWPDQGTFIGAPFVDDFNKLDADVTFVGVPFDFGTLHRSGERDAPDAIRVISRWFEDGSDGVYDFERRAWILRGVKMADAGNVDIRPSDFKPNFDRITEVVRQAQAHQTLLVALGGDHSISFPLIRGLDKPGLKLHVIHFDSHIDYGDGLEDARFHHGACMRRVGELPFVSGITSIGTRTTMFKDTWVTDAKRLGKLKNITTAEALSMGPVATIAKVPKADAYYITVDVDVLDPSVCPAVNTPEPGGFSYRELRALLAELAKRKNVVGIDFVEHVPSLDDASHRSSQVIARLIIDLLADLETAGRFTKPKTRARPSP
jgi:agmatinase